MAALDEMTEDQVLDAASDRAAQITRAETELLELAYQWAVLHSPERLDPRVSAKPGREKPKLLGGAGTPMVTEFAAAELGARIGRSPYAAARLIGDALDLQHRHPQLWARVQAGEVRASYARHVVTKTRELEPDEAGYVDSAVVESADGRIPWSRFEALVAAKVAQAAPAAHRAKEEQAARSRFAKKLPTSVADEALGMATYLVRADVATIDTIATAVEAHATTLDPDLSADDRRVGAVLDLLTGDAVARPNVQLYVHTYTGHGTGTDTGTGTGTGHEDREPVMRLEGHGPVTDEWVRNILGPIARFTIRPILDLAGQAPVDSWEIPDRHRQAVHLMTPADTFPHASCTSRTMQTDHTIPFDQGGPSDLTNYGPMTTHHHRIKTHSRWRVRQPFPGIYLWQDPHGQTYLVDHTGTRRLPGDPAPQVEVELWHVPFELRIDYAA